MVDQVQKLEMECAAAEKRVKSLETALRAIMELGKLAHRGHSEGSYAFCAGRIQQIAEFALNPDVLEAASE